MKKNQNKKKRKKIFWIIIILIIISFAIFKIFKKDIKIVEKEIYINENGEEVVGKIKDKKGWLDKLNPEQGEDKPKDIDGLYNKPKSTFTDLFSSTARIDEEKTSLRFDWNGKVISFPLKVEFKQFDLDFFNHFSPKITQTSNDYPKSILLIGKNTKEHINQAILWKPELLYKDNSKENSLKVQKFEKINLKDIGISNINDILKISFYDNNYLLFIKNNKGINIKVLNNKLSLKNEKEIDIDDSNLKISCSKNSCLLYDSGENIVTNLNLKDLKLSKIDSLSEKLQNISPEQVEFSFNEVLNSWIIASLKTQQFKLWQFKNGEVKTILKQASKYPGTLNLKCFENGKTFLLWASYYSRGYLVDKNLEVNDLSERLGFRASKDFPVLIKENNGLIYLLREDKILLRFDGDVIQRMDEDFWHYRKAKFSNIFFNKDLKSQGIILTYNDDEGMRVYKFFDQGFDLSAIRTIVSKKFNSSATSKILGAQIIEVEKKSNNSAFRYFLSNNNGKDWQEVEVGQAIKFKNRGNNLIWKAKIAPYKKANAFKPPYLNTIHLQYWYQR